MTGFEDWENIARDLAQSLLSISRCTDDNIVYEIALETLERHKEAFSEFQNSDNEDDGN